MNIWDKLILGEVDAEDQELTDALGLNFELRYELTRLMHKLITKMQEQHDLSPTH